MIQLQFAHMLLDVSAAVMYYARCMGWRFTEAGGAVEEDAKFGRSCMWYARSSDRYNKQPQG